MLANSFSFLPIHAVWEAPARWLLISDHSIAKFLRGSSSMDNRNRRLATLVQKAIESGQLEADEADKCALDDTLDEVLLGKASRLLLVLDRTDSSRLVGAITSFDLL